MRFPKCRNQRGCRAGGWRKEIKPAPVSHSQMVGDAPRLCIQGHHAGRLSDCDTRIWDSFYERHNFSGKVVLDPFMGSGRQLAKQSSSARRLSVADINPVSTFLVRQAFARVDEGDLRATFEKLEREVGPRDQTLLPDT